MQMLSVAVASLIFCGVSPEQASDPVRHSVQLPMPIRLKVRRIQSQISESFDLASVRSVRIMVNEDMFIGLRDEVRAYRRGSPRPENPGRVSYASMDARSAPSETGFLKSTNLWNGAQDNIPLSGERYTIEHHLSIFETDVPPQHMWSGVIGGRFRVLWDRTLKADSR